MSYREGWEAEGRLQGHFTGGHSLPWLLLFVAYLPWNKHFVTNVPEVMVLFLSTWSQWLQTKLSETVSQIKAFFLYINYIRCQQSPEIEWDRLSLSRKDLLNSKSPKGSLWKVSPQYDDEGWQPLRGGGTWQVVLRSLQCCPQIGSSSI